MESTQGGRKDGGTAGVTSLDDDGTCSCGSADDVAIERHRELATQMKRALE